MDRQKIKPTKTSTKGTSQGTSQKEDLMIEMSALTYIEAERLYKIFAKRTGCNEGFDYFVNSMLTRGMINYVTEVLSVSDLMGEKP